MTAGAEPAAVRKPRADAERNRARLLETAKAAFADKGSAASLDEIVIAVAEPITAMAVRAWPADFPEDIATLRRVPYESRADSVMYCQVLAQLGRERGWSVLTYNARDVEGEAARWLGHRADDVLLGPRTSLGPPWAKDHRMALAATIVAS